MTRLISPNLLSEGSGDDRGDRDAKCDLYRIRYRYGGVLLPPTRHQQGENSDIHRYYHRKNHPPPPEVFKLLACIKPFLHFILLCPICRRARVIWFLKNYILHRHYNNKIKLCQDKASYYRAKFSILLKNGSIDTLFISDIMQMLTINTDIYGNKTYFRAVGIKR